MDCSMPDLPVHHQLKLMSIESVMTSSHLILCHPLLFPPSIFPSIRVFSNESVLCIRWPKYWSFSFSISPSNEHSGLISFRMDWLDLLAVQGTLKSLLQEEEPRWRRSRTGRTLSPPNKFIKRAFKRRVNSTKQLLNASRGHQAPRKATQLFERR